MIRLYTSPTELEEACNICISHKLYVEGWSFEYWADISHRESLSASLIYWDQNIPVGISFIMKKYGVNVGFFISPQYRNRGVGTSLYNETRKYAEQNKLKFSCGKGVDGSHIFFRKCVDRFQ